MRLRSSKLTGSLHFPFQPGPAACKHLHDQASCPLLPWNQEEHAAPGATLPGIHRSDASQSQAATHADSMQDSTCSCAAGA